MKFYVLASLIVFILVIAHNVRKSGKIQAARERSFWERERLANETRRKPLDDLNYISIPLDRLPMHVMEQEEQTAECLRIIRELSAEPIVNLTGITNTDLKLEYGAANINVLTQYDQNYTLLAGALQKWAELLYGAGYVDEARQILEFAVETHTDVSRCYDLLSDIYLQNGESHKLAWLEETAETLNSLSREGILRRLREKTARSESDR